MVGITAPVTADGIFLRDILTMIISSIILFVPLLTRYVLTKLEGAVFLGIYVGYIFLLLQ